MNSSPLTTTARLLITCADRPGIVSTVTSFLYTHGANINTLDQHTTDPEGGMFFMRLEFQTPNLDLSRTALEQNFQQVVATTFNMSWKISYAADRKKTAILVSKYDHALMELLWRWERGELYTDLTMVISNHPDLREAVEGFSIPYHHIPITSESKEEAETAMLQLLDGQADLIVLARYMQIISPRFIDSFAEKIINIHHSFLPAFVGANPYMRAYERGVKLIGATAHYVTEDLDAGPIIEQDVLRVSHRDCVDDLKRIGEDIERHVLARAVKWHLEDRVIAFGNKTVVFA